MLENRIAVDKFLYHVRESNIVPEGGKILELGTGNNATVLELFSDKYEVQPSDIYPEDSDIPDVIKVDATNISVSAAAAVSWDAIIATELIEHVRYPSLVFEQCWRYLSSCGVFVVTVPFFYRIHEWDRDDPTTTEPNLKDYWRVTPRGLTVLFEDAGFPKFWTGAGKGDLVYGESYVLAGGLKDDTWTPSHVFGWGIKALRPPLKGCRRLNVCGDWPVELPGDWREEQIKLAKQYQEAAEAMKDG